MTQVFLFKAIFVGVTKKKRTFLLFSHKNNWIAQQRSGQWWRHAPTADTKAYNFAVHSSGVTHQQFDSEAIIKSHRYKHILWNPLIIACCLPICIWLLDWKDQVHWPCDLWQYHTLKAEGFIIKWQIRHLNIQRSARDSPLKNKVQATT